MAKILYFCVSALIMFSTREASAQIFAPYESPPPPEDANNANPKSSNPRINTQPKVRTQPKANIPPKPKKLVEPKIIPPRPEPPQVLVPDSSKSAEQRSYEVESQRKLDDMIARVKTLEDRIEKLPKDERQDIRSKLQTAQGNRSVVRTKLKQLKYVRPNDWFALKGDIEKSFINLSDSVELVEGMLSSETSEASDLPTKGSDSSLQE